MMNAERSPSWHDDFDIRYRSRDISNLTDTQPVSMIEPRIDAKQAQIFVDNHIIHDYQRVHRTIHRPKIFGPVLKPERPWEGNCIVLYGSVVRTEGKMMMWYQTFNKVDSPSERAYICYAESDDGIKWVKPELGNVSFRGSNSNNIALRPMEAGLDSPSVILDERGPPDERFKLLVYGRTTDGQSGLFSSISDDGKRWTDPCLAAPELGDRTNLMYDDRTKRPYVAFTRAPSMMRDHHRRVIYRSDSADFRDWSEPELVLKPDLADSHDLQFYGMSAFRYGQVYIGFLQCLHTGKDLMDVQLVSSRDGIHWERTEPRDVFISPARSEDWDTTWISFSSSPPIRTGDRLWLYYEDRNASHAQQYPLPRGCISLATMRLDGFASIDAGPSLGTLTTREFVWPGGDLAVNINSKASSGPTDRAQLAGRSQVEILGEDDSPVRGFDRGTCRPFGGDSVDHRYEWESGRTLEDLDGELIRIRFYMVNSELYSFRAVAVDEA